MTGLGFETSSMETCGVQAAWRSGCRRRRPRWRARRAARCAAGRLPSAPAPPRAASTRTLGTPRRRRPPLLGNLDLLREGLVRSPAVRSQARGARPQPEGGAQAPVLGVPPLRGGAVPRQAAETRRAPAAARAPGRPHLPWSRPWRRARPAPAWTTWRTWRAACAGASCSGWTRPPWWSADHPPLALGPFSRPRPLRCSHRRPMQRCLAVLPPQI